MEKGNDQQTAAGGAVAVTADHTAATAVTAGMGAAVAATQGGGGAVATAPRHDPVIEETRPDGTRAVSTRGPDDWVETKVYGPDGKLLRTEHEGPGSDGMTDRQVYDAGGSLISREQWAANTSTETHPDGSRTVRASDGTSVTTREYDSDGNWTRTIEEIDGHRSQTVRNPDGTATQSRTVTGEVGGHGETTWDSDGQITNTEWTSDSGHRSTSTRNPDGTYTNTVTKRDGTTETTTSEYASGGSYLGQQQSGHAHERGAEKEFGYEY